MELKYLYTVKKVIETGSYQNAAAALSYAQSTITFQMKQLENELGVKLFEKNGSKMELTQGGKELLPLIDKVLESVNELLCHNGSGGDIRGALTVALPETLVTYKLQPVLKEFKKKAPQVRLSLKVMNCYAIYEQMMNGKADIAIHYDVAKYPESFTARVIGTYPLVLVSSFLLADKDRDFVSPDQKKSVCHIENDPNAFYLKIWKRYLKKKNIALETGLEVWSIEAVKRSVMSNLGVAFLPRFAVEEELEKGLLCEIPLDMDNEEMDAVSVYSKNKWQSPAMKLFLQILYEHFDRIS